MDIRLKFLAVLVTLFVLALSGLGLWSYSLDKKYPELSYTDALNDTVTYVISDGGQAAGRVRLSNGKKKSLPWAKTVKYGEEFNLPGIIEIGDVLLKSASSDTIMVLRRHKQYVFVAHKVIK